MNRRPILLLLACASALGAYVTFPRYELHTVTCHLQEDDKIYCQWDGRPFTEEDNKHIQLSSSMNGVMSPHCLKPYWTEWVGGSLGHDEKSRSWDGLYWGQTHDVMFTCALGDRPFWKYARVYWPDEGF